MKPGVLSIIEGKGAQREIKTFFSEGISEEYKKLCFEAFLDVKEIESDLIYKFKQDGEVVTLCFGSSIHRQAINVKKGQKLLVKSDLELSLI